MELALYCPVYGYYEKEGDTIGRRGDFFTSVSTGRLFGELMAFQISAWLESMRDAESPLQIVEGGAHDGLLASDILRWLRSRRPEIFGVVEYWILEPSAARRSRQQQTLGEFGAAVRWANDFEDGWKASSPSFPATPRGICGVIFSNELLDAMPVHRIGWDAKGKDWFEWGVGVRDGKLGWTRLPCLLTGRPPHGLPELPQALLDVLPDGFTTEICPAAERWWSEAARSLKRGKLLTIDYGLEAEEFFAPGRESGTLRAYRRHHPAGDLLSDVGEQDMTAHVNFTAIRSAGESAGLRTEQFTTQSKFLSAIAERQWREPAERAEWSSSWSRQFQTLIHPEHLGERFQVLVQSRD